MTDKTKPFKILLLLPADGSPEMVVECSRIIARSRQGRLHLLANRFSAANQEKQTREPITFFDHRSQLIAAAQDQAADQADPVNLLVIGWSRDPEWLQDMLNLAIQLNLQAIVINWPADQPSKRILLSTSGGLHTVPQVWLVSTLARSLGIPVHLLRIIQPRELDPEDRDKSEEELKLTRLQLRMLGLHVPVETEIADDVVNGVRAAVQAEDLMVVGAPNYGRTLNHFEGSIPDLLMRDRKHPSMMLLADKPREVSLKTVFWEETIRLDLHPANKRELLTTLINILIEQRQIPPEWREQILAKALLREQIQPTSTGCETAFPHIAIPGFRGITGCFGICPRGIDFGEPEHSLVRFVFLLVTPDEDYHDYLKTLAHLARHMIRPETRRKLLACRTPAEVKMILNKPIPNPKYGLGTTPA